MNTYTNCLPAWSVGPDCYKEVFSVVRRYGRTAAVVEAERLTALDWAGRPGRNVSFLNGLCPKS